LPDTTNKPDSGTVPDPNLNPLSNPVLGQHMGRWAEVYFTTPPEKRREAVQQLLRELAADSRAERATLKNRHEQVESRDPVMESRSWSEAVPLAVVCRQCGGESPASQKYCGSCGAVLPEGTRWPSSVAPASEWQTAHSSLEEAPFAPFASLIRDASLDASLGASDDEEALRPVAGDAPRFIPEYEPVRYRYRLYVGAALAALIGLLVFAAWRINAVSSDGTAPGVQQPAPLPALPPSTQPTASSSPQGSAMKVPPPPQSPPVASTPHQLANRAAAPEPRSPAAPQASGTKAPPAQSAQVTAPPAQLANGSVAPAPRSPAAPLLAANRAPVAENTGVPGTVGDGSDELAVAQSYLNGRHGAPRDSTEAVRWLWRSVAKQNATATLLLSDFYLRGDGVSKSCDQARLLLDAAARKGKAAAGERLRNLQAFGCQ
jgi:hypothetical protein